MTVVTVYLTHQSVLRRQWVLLLTLNVRVEGTSVFA